MMGKIRKVNAAAVIVLAAAGLAPGVSAQVPAAPPVSPVMNTSADWIEMADALVQSAAQAPGVEAGCEALIAAANAYRVAGRANYARHVALEAATRARHAGLAVTAARAYFAAATLSKDLHEPDVALGYFAQCRQLADLAPAVRMD
jgi:hypothetical protein